MSNIFGYPNYINGSSGGGTSYLPGAGLTSTTNPDGTITLSASGPFVTYYYDPSIANSRQMVAGNNVTLSTALDGQIVISAAATGGGAPTVSSYIVATTEASLPNSLVQTQGNGITVTNDATTSTIGLASTVTGAKLLTWDSGDTIFVNRRQLILGSGLNAAYGTNTLTLTATSATNGTVTSVGLTAPSWLTVGSSPVTTAGTISLTATNQSANTLLIGPSGGADAPPTFRKLLGVDLPISGGSNIVLSTDSTGGLNIASTGGGGSGTVTTLSVGDLSPVFTSNVANATTTPAVTYSLTSAAQNAALMGPKTGGAGSPTYRAITGQDLGNLVAGANVTISAVGDTLVFASTASGGGGGSVTSFSSGNLSPLFTTNVATATTTPALTFTIAQGASGQFVAGPVSGAAANLALRALATSDLPVGIPAGNISSGTVSDLEFGYLDGVTSAIQTQFTNKQPLDATLTALAAYNTNGVLTQTAVDTFVGRTITGTANEVTVTNGNGVSGNPTLSLASGIDATKIADGTVTSTEFQYINTLSSNAQTQIDGKAANTEAFVTLGTTTGLTNERALTVAGGLTIQDNGAGSTVTLSASALQPLDATLTALANYNASGFVTQTGVDTFAGRTLAAAGGLTIQEAGSVITVSGSAINGTVTSFSAGDLLPLFTTTESTVTTTPSLSFVAVAQASGGLALLSPASGADAAATFRSIGGSDLAQGVIAGANITLTQVPSSNQLRITAAAGGGSSIFTSSDQTITSAGPLTLAHGLPSTPKQVWMALICQTTEANYAVSDVVVVTEINNVQTSGGGAGYGCTVVTDATNLNVRFGSNTSVFTVLSKTTGANAILTNTNWKVRFYAS